MNESGEKVNLPDNPKVYFSMDDNLAVAAFFGKNIISPGLLMSVSLHGVQVCFSRNNLLPGIRDKFVLHPIYRTKELAFLNKIEVEIYRLLDNIEFNNVVYNCFFVTLHRKQELLLAEFIEQSFLHNGKTA